MMDQKTMFCSYCGKEILKDSNYCPYCGHKVDFYEGDQKKDSKKKKITKEELEKDETRDSLDSSENEEVASQTKFKNNQEQKKQADSSDDDQESENQNVDKTNNDKSDSADHSNKQNKNSKKDTNDQGINIQFTSNAFQNIFKWFESNIYLTVFAVLALFVIFSFSTLFGWIIAIVCVILVFLFANNSRHNKTNMESSIRDKIQNSDHS